MAANIQMDLHLKIPQGSTVIWLLSCENKMQQTILLRPTLEDLVVDDNQVFTADYSLYPAYLYLSPGGKSQQTITLKIPQEISAGENIKTWLRFPAIQEEAFAIKIEILPAHPLNKSQIVELSLPVVFPFSHNNSESHKTSPNSETAGIYGLISGIIDLDKIPSRWLIAEILVILAQKGEEFAKTKNGQVLLNQLRQQSFFQTGVKSLNYAKLPQWIADSILAENITLTGFEGGLIKLWERWLLSLIASDIECSELRENILTSPLLQEEFLSKIGMNSERCFANIILGITQISPRFTANLESMIKSKNQELSEKKRTEIFYILSAALPSYDNLPARWLVCEILLIFAAKGNEYASSKTGGRLLNELQRTRFFKNGVIAFASAQVPRWITLTHAAASAFHTEIGGQPGKQGLIYFWENYLGSLAGEQNEIIPPNFAGDAICKKLSMNTEEWFTNIILGLALISPKIDTVLTAIAQTSPKINPSNSPHQTPIKNILKEAKSLQR